MTIDRIDGDQIAQRDSHGVLAGNIQIVTPQRPTGTAQAGSGMQCQLSPLAIVFNRAGHQPRQRIHLVQLGGVNQSKRFCSISDFKLDGVGIGFQLPLTVIVFRRYLDTDHVIIAVRRFTAAIAVKKAFRVDLDPRAAAACAVR